jgi:hypothetical protein
VEEIPVASFGSKTKLSKRSTSKKHLFGKGVSKKKTPTPTVTPTTGEKKTTVAGPITTTAQWNPVTPQGPRTTGPDQQPLLQTGRQAGNQTVLTTQPAPPVVQAPPVVSTAPQILPPGKKKALGRPKGMLVEKVANENSVALAPEGVDVVTIAKIRAKVAAEHSTKVEAVLRAMTEDGQPPMSVTALATWVNQVGAAYDQIVANPNAVGPMTATARIASLMKETADTVDELGTMISTDRSLQEVPLAKLRLLRDGLRQNPALCAYYKSKGIKFSFRSGSAKNQGGGVYISLAKTVHMDALDDVSPESYVRLLLHESGHATLQRLLMPEDRMPNKKNLDSFWDKGTGNDLRTERAQLQQAVADGTLRPDDPGLLARTAQIDQQFATEDPDNGWDRLSDDTKELYNAWVVLRRNRGQYMLGIDLGGTLDEQQRQDYQAGYFSEFVAESFMHVATGDIDDHLADIRADPSVPQDVKAAWEVAAAVLGRNAARTILARDPVL